MPRCSSSSATARIRGDATATATSPGCCANSPATGSGSRRSRPRRTPSSIATPRPRWPSSHSERGMSFDGLPLVSCIMPTRDRRHFVGQAVKYFERQTYPHKELVVVDDGADSVADFVGQGPAIKYLRFERPQSIGAKRNLAIGAARGTIVMHWDDDDWHGENRIAHQIQPLCAGAAGVSGLKTGCMLNVSDVSFWTC